MISKIRLKIVFTKQKNMYKEIIYGTNKLNLKVNF